jgi:tRNA threonylcarbamoyladenosine biosynthesis protein TsaB
MLPLFKVRNRLGGLVLGVESEIWPRAACIAQLANSGLMQHQELSVELAMPVYLRDKVAKKQTERKNTNA